MDIDKTILNLHRIIFKLIIFKLFYEVSYVFLLKRNVRYQVDKKLKINWNLFIYFHDSLIYLTI